jgi:phosphatidate cytidylyltransferase
MTLYESFFVVLAGLIGVFTAATAAGDWLQSHTLDPARSATLAQLNSRIRSSWFIVLWFGIAFLLGPTALVLLFALASFFALREFMALTPLRASDHWALVIAFYVVIPAHYALVSAGLYGWYAVFIPVYVFLALPVVMALRQDTALYLQRVAKVQWGLMIAVYCVSHAPAIASLEIPEYGERAPLLLVYFLLVVHASDLLSVAATSLFGRTPLKSNPAKTREGVLAGGAAATLLGTALWWMTPFLWWQALLISAVTVMAGLTGGLVLASVKTSMGARDSYEGIQLSRGMLERLDALTFAAPVFFHIVYYFFVP